MTKKQQPSKQNIRAPTFSGDLEDRTAPSPGRSSEVRDQALPDFHAAWPLAASWEEAESTQQLAGQQRGCCEMLNRSDSTADTFGEKAKTGRQSAKHRNEWRTAKGWRCKREDVEETPSRLCSTGKRNAVKESLGPEGTSLRLLERFCSPPTKTRQYRL